MSTISNQTHYVGSFPSTSTEIRIQKSQRKYAQQIFKNTKEESTEKKIMRAAWEVFTKDHRSFNSMRSGNGSTGLTYICSLKRDSLKKNQVNERDLPEFAQIKNCLGEGFEKDLIFILKHVNSNNARNERVCADLYKKFQLNAPTLHFVRSEIVDGRKKTALNFFEKIHNSAINQCGELVFMYAYEAADLDSLIKTEAFFKINKKDFSTIIEKIGEVSIFDLLIANNDRFFRHSEENPSQVKAFCNPGNIMFKLEGNSFSKKLVETYMIDNATTQALCPKRSPAIDDPFDSLSFLGDSNGNEKASLSSTEENSDKNLEEKKLTDYSEAFKYYSSEKNHKEFSEIICNSFMSLIDQYRLHSPTNNFPAYFWDIEEIKKNLQQGFNSALEKLRKININQLLTELKNSNSEKNEFVEISLNLVELGLLFLKQQ